MPRESWHLQFGRPVIQVVLTLIQGGQKVTRTLLADSGAGAIHNPADLILDEVDCLLCGSPSKMVALGGSYSGTFPLYAIPVEVPLLNFQGILAVVGVSATPKNTDGIACFRFLNRFTYGNFGDPNAFGLEM